MKSLKYKSIVPVVIAACMLLTLGGCMRSGIQIVPIPNQDVLSLNANQVVQILKAIGFSDQEIIDYGWSVREGLARSGRVRIMIDDVIEAGLGVKGDDVYISSRTMGFAIFNIKTGMVNINEIGQ